MLLLCILFLVISCTCEQTNDAPVERRFTHLRTKSMERVYRPVQSEQRGNTKVWKNSIEVKRLQDTASELESDTKRKDTEQEANGDPFPFPTVLPLSSTLESSANSASIVVLNYSTLSLTPISAVVQVNVTSPSRVWCGVLDPGKPFIPEEIKASHPSVLVQNSSVITVNALRPNTLYNFYCYGESDYGPMAESALASMKRVNTPPTIFQIKNEKIWNTMLSFVLESNIRLDATCVLFDDQSREIKSVRTNSMERQTVHFEAIDSSRRYFVQCAIISNGKEIAKTDITSFSNVPKRVSFFYIAVKAIIIILLCLITALLMSFIYLKRRHTTLYDNDESEKVALLRRKPKFPPTPHTFCQDYEAAERAKGNQELLRYYQSEEKEKKKGDVVNEKNGME